MLAYQIECAAQQSGKLRADKNGKLVKMTFDLKIESEEDPQKKVDGIGEFNIDGRLIEAEWKAEFVKNLHEREELVYRFSVQ